MKFELFIAARYLRAKRRQAFIGVITAISVIGVAVGVASLVIALAASNGNRRVLEEQLLGATAHVNLMRVQSDGIADWENLSQRLSKQPHVVATAPAIYEQVLISRGARAKGAVLKGVVPDRERNVSELIGSVKLGSAKALDDAQAQPPPSQTGSGDDSATDNSAPDKTKPAARNPDPASSLAASKLRVSSMAPIILGKDMADDLGATVGSVVLVTSPQGELTPFGIVPKYVRFKVVGIFKSGFYDYDSTWALTDLRDAQKLFGLGDIVSVIEFKVDNIYNAGVIGTQLEKTAGPGFQSTSWMEQNHALFDALRMERKATYLIIGLIMIVAALNILVSLIMTVMEKTKNIAVLVAMGARRSQILRIFILQGMLIGVIGTVLGLILGYSISWALDYYRLFPLSAEVYTFNYLHFEPRALDGVLVSIVALIISFVATIYPSYSASRVLPAEALRYE